MMPPARHLGRLKASLDSCDPVYWDGLVGRAAWQRVVNNIKTASKLTVTSVTYTLTAENYRQAGEFIRWARQELPDIYALFFSVYKGNRPRFQFAGDDIDTFFATVYPEMCELLDEESLALLQETLTNKQRMIAGVRFPDNNLDEPCYLSMSERVISPTGEESFCSHLYRDGVTGNDVAKCGKCQYGCNQRLVDFNNLVSRQLLDKRLKCGML
jgi:hypothetical protein